MDNGLCSILIPNKDSYEAIQLCIESIRKYTNYPYKILIFDDKSENGVDIEYLGEAQRKCWLWLYENNSSHSYGHGGVLNVLINEICQTPLAMIIDSDVYIKDYGWLSEMIDKIDMQKDLAVCDTIPKGMFTVQGYRMPICDFSFGLINMNVYRDNMQVDWKPKKSRQER